MAETENKGNKGDSGPRGLPNYCFFCRRHYRYAGPLAEGPAMVLICYECIQACARLIEDACRANGLPMPGTGPRWWERKAGDNVTDRKESTQDPSLGSELGGR